jgi:hypothetical protein
MRNLFVVLIFFFSSGTAFSQAICSFDKLHNSKLQKDPQYKKAVEENEKVVQRYIAKYKNRLSARTKGLNATLYTIPVVVHVMHTGGTVGSIYNPTDAQIQGAINYLNQVYNGTYPGTQGIGDIQIQFVLAAKDPNCNNTTGIERINASGIAGYSANGVSTDPGTTPGVDELLVKDLSRWNAFQYYNIWIVNKIDGKDGTSGQFIAGYAYFPGAPAWYDGTIMLATQMVAGQKTLPHEIGHAFGLYHPFEGSPDRNTCSPNVDCNTDNDRVCDTDPITFNQLGGVVDFSCRTGINPCTSSAYSSNTESNYMNYTNCYNLFTAGQKARMLAFAASPYRKSLATSLALNSSYPITYSPPIAASCTPSTSASGLSMTAAGILNIDLNGQSLGSSLAAYDNGYVNGTASCLNLIQLVRGSSYTITVNVAGINQEQLRAWIDYNNDGSFNNATEQILFNSAVTTASPVTSASFTIPNTVPLNTMLRMRVIDDLAVGYPGTATIGNACYNPVYGQAEDYPVYIISGVLPVTLSDFTGVLKNQNAVLSWNTSTGQGLKNFEIQKSTDGLSFETIGVVNVNAQNPSSHSYTYADVDLSENNYYRLKMNDISGSYKLSDVVLVRYGGTEQKIWIVTNPFSSAIEMRLTKAGSKVRLQLLNSSGAVVAEKEVNSSSGYIKWDIPPSLSKGHYIIKAIIDNKMVTSKLIKQ